MTGLLTAGSGQDWENDLVAALARPGSPFTVVRRCVDVAELLTVAGTGQAGVVVVSAELRQLSGDAVMRLTSTGVAVVGVHAPGDAATRVRLERMGIAAMAASDAGATALTDLAGTALLELALDGPRRSSAVADPRSVPAWQVERPDAGLPDTGPPDAGADQQIEPGRVIAVWGPTGAPGRTTVAVNLAAEAAATGTATMLIDADTYGGVVANAFGLLDESPGLAGACRMAANGRLDAAQLAALSWQVGPVRVLTGIARPDRWPEVRPSAIPAVLDIARRSAGLIVVDCGFSLEADEEISFDTSAPRRNGATLAVLEAADLVLAVGAADPPGMERLIRGLTELADAVPGTQPRVVLNRLRRTAAGKDEAADAVARFTGLGVTAALPEDREATDKAWRRGLPLCQVAANSPLRTGLRELAGQLAPASNRS